MCEVGVESVKLPFLNLMYPMLVTSLPNVFSFWGIYFIGGKVEKLINASIEHFHSKHKLLLHEIKVICQIDDQENTLEGHWHTSLGNQSKLRFKINVLSKCIF